MARFFKKFFSVLFLAVSCILCGCATVGEYVYFSDIAQHKWVPVYVADTEDVEVPQNAETEFGAAHIIFSPSEDGYDVRGMSGCNLFHGGMELKGGRKVEFTRMLKTKRAGKYAGYERKFVQAVSTTRFILRDGEFLYFCSKSGGAEMAILKFRKEPL